MTKKGIMKYALMGLVLICITILVLIYFTVKNINNPLKFFIDGPPQDNLPPMEDDKINVLGAELSYSLDGKYVPYIGSYYVTDLWEYNGELIPKGKSISPNTIDNSISIFLDSELREEFAVDLDLLKQNIEVYVDITPGWAEPKKKEDWKEYSEELKEQNARESDPDKKWKPLYVALGAPSDPNKPSVKDLIYISNIPGDRFVMIILKNGQPDGLMSKTGNKPMNMQRAVLQFET
jgi:hypothetical protein